MRFGVIGVNHKLADVHLREELAKATLRKFTLGISHHLEHPCVVLTTCNRIEIYFSSDDLPTSQAFILAALREEVKEDFEQKLYTFFDEDCFKHLCRVTAGLDSAIIAETEIQGQVKAAYEQASKTALLPSALHYLFQKALKIAKQVRTHLPMMKDIPDLEHAILNQGKKLFNNSQQPRILVIGASVINLKIVTFLKNKQMENITLCNRTPLTEEDHPQFLRWENLKTWINFDWIIFGTKAPHYLIHNHELPNECSRKFIVDLSVPRNVHPSLADHAQVKLMNIDQLNCLLTSRKSQLELSLNQAESLIADLTKSTFDRRLALIG